MEAFWRVFSTILNDFFEVFQSMFRYFQIVTLKTFFFYFFKSAFFFLDVWGVLGGVWGYSLCFFCILGRFQGDKNKGNISTKRI